MAAKTLYISGIVQGVGFRPFVYRLAHQYGLKGDVANTSAGVRIRLEGTADAVTALSRDITASPPPLAVITEIRAVDTPPRGFMDFAIVPSIHRTRVHAQILIPPDTAVCDDCLAEMFDPGNRRYRYPFINCTQCGPRYTIIQDIPYDRAKTTMAAFAMCPECRAEYSDPANRRFHAEATACPACGPRVSLTDSSGRPAADDPIAAAAALLKAGGILAVKGIGGFHLAADAENADAVLQLRRRKGRQEKPFALMARDLIAAGRLVRIRPEEAATLLSPQRPIVLLEKRGDGSPAAPGVAPGNCCFGVMLPYAPLHHLLFAVGGIAFTALVMTSGNIGDAPMAIDTAAARQSLSGIADAFLIHDRDICQRSDDAIVRHIGGRRRFIRRSRGYAPTPIFLHRPLPPILACGAELKNAVCLTQKRCAYLSPHIGDVKNLETYRFLNTALRHLERILDIAPEIVAHDAHPDYLSTRYARMRSSGIKVPVQHHHAHIAAAMAENRLEGPVIGLAFDGTGHGTDGAVWGGEVLKVDYRSFERAAHLAYTPMPGGDAAVREPWRMALAYLHGAFGKALRELDLPMLRHLDGNRVHTVLAMVEGGFQAPLTSSLGRLFDGIAALLDIRYDVTFEGQAAMALEMSADPSETGCYACDRPAENSREIPLLPIIEGVVRDRLSGLPVPVISQKFHNTLIRLFTALCTDIRRDAGLDRVVMSGGAFQNVILLDGLTRALNGEGFTVFNHIRVPTHDGGIALGQAMVAAATAG